MAPCLALLAILPIAKVRNHVLTLWRLDVSRWLTEEEAAAKIMPRFRAMVTAAWRFLTTGGYINFGVGPGIAQRPNIEQQRESIIVIGAGLAGGRPHSSQAAPQFHAQPDPGNGRLLNTSSHHGCAIAACDMYPCV